MCVLHEIEDEPLDEPDEHLLNRIYGDRGAELTLEALTAVAGHTRGYLEKLARLYQLTRLRASSLPKDLDESRIPPLLVLADLPEEERQETYKARIVGFGPFAGVTKKIGSRELFFLYLLFDSKDVREQDGAAITVVTRDDVATALLKWSEAGHLKLGGRDLKRPRDRVQKMWHEFTRQMKRQKMLKDLFVRFEADGQELYGIRVHTATTQILITNLPRVLRNS